MRLRAKSLVILGVVLVVVVLIASGANYYYKVLPFVQAGREYREGIRLYEAGSNEESVRHLSATLQGPAGMVPVDRRVRAVEVLGLIGAKHWDEQRSGGIGLVSAAGSPLMSRIVWVLATSLRDQESGVRRAAVQALGMTGAYEAIAPITAALENQDASVRREVVFALATLCNAADLNSSYHPPELRPLVDAADGKVHQALAAALKDSDPEVRERAAIALGRIGERGVHRYDPRAGPLLRQAMPLLLGLIGVMRHIGPKTPTSRRTFGASRKRQ